MVVVDTGSVDNTIAIARAWGATVHQRAWPGDFAAVRNQALDLVRGDWVLVLDGDEWLLPGAQAPLKALMARPDVLAITLLRRELGAALAPYSCVSRLFRRHRAIRWQRAYHSLVDDSVAALLEHEPHWRIEHCAEPALGHDGYAPERRLALAKAQRLRQAMESELLARPGDPYTCAKLGGLEVAEGNRSRGLALLHSGLAQCAPEQVPERYELLLNLALALAPTDADGAASHYQQALALPLDPRITLAARLNLASLALDLGQVDQAAALCLEATQAAPEVALGWLNLGLSERRRGRLEAASRAYRQAIDLEPELPEAHQNLALALLLMGDIPAARQGFSHTLTLLERQNRQAEAQSLRQRLLPMVNLPP
jgi:tetratricopeptide (TPR) repeat protein